MTAGRDEFAVIDALRARFEGAGGHLPAGDLGIGDDAAVVTLPGGGRVVLATDLVVEGVHVDLATCSPEDVGWKALMVAVSDVGAMGCAPTHVLLSVADSMERRTWRRLDLTVRLIEPILLLVLAGVILMLVIALLVPVLKMSAMV